MEEVRLKCISELATNVQSCMCALQRSACRVGLSQLVGLLELA